MSAHTFSHLASGSKSVHQQLIPSDCKTGFIYLFLTFRKKVFKKCIDKEQSSRSERCQCHPDLKNKTHAYNLKDKQVFNVFSLTNMQILFSPPQCWQRGAIFYYVVKWRIHANKYPIPNKWLCCNPSFEFASDHYIAESVRTQLGAAFVARFAILSIRSSAMSFFLCSLLLLLHWFSVKWISLRRSPQQRTAEVASNTTWVEGAIPKACMKNEEDAMSPRPEK